jgi:hypothetical protein
LLTRLRLVLSVVARRCSTAPKHATHMLCTYD